MLRLRDLRHSFDAHAHSACRPARGHGVDTRRLATAQTYLVYKPRGERDATAVGGVSG
jgi:hypothetical protein